MKNAVITGATSSLGTALIDECISNNINVLALVNPGSDRIPFITEHPLVNIRECSLEDMSSFSGDKLDDAVFFHLAWGSTRGEKARSDYYSQLQNVKYSLDAVDLAERLGCNTFIGAGSQAEYGRTDKVLVENVPCNPETAYGMAKLCAGQMTRLSCKEKGIRHVWPRILSTYGPKYQAYTVINYTILELLRGNTPLLTRGEQVWDFLYSEDCARALYLLAEKGKDGEVYIVGSGQSRPLREYLLEVRDIIDPNLDLGLGIKEYTENTVMHLACDISKLKRDTGFQPVVSFDEGIRHTVEWNQRFMID